MYCEGENVEENHEEQFKWLKNQQSKGIKMLLIS